MKITVKHSNKLVPFEDIPEGMVFQAPATTGDTYYIKTSLEVNDDTGADEWNALNLDNYTLDCFSPKHLVLPIYGAELIIS
jgi:hypothetical protein